MSGDGRTPYDCAVDSTSVGAPNLPNLRIHVGAFRLAERKNVDMHTAHSFRPSPEEADMNLGDTNCLISCVVRDAAR